MMKAIQLSTFGGPEVLKLVDIPVPEPGPGQVRVCVKAAGVNPVDTYWRSGANPTLSLPLTPGLDGAGLVESLGPSVTEFAVGDLVYFGGWLTGAYAEKAVLRVSQLHALPAGVTFQQGAALHVPYATAHRALFHRAGARAGDVILIHGASGGVGLAATQFASAAGMTVIGTAGTERGRQLVEAQGARYVLDHTEPHYLNRIPELTGGRGVDVVLEMLANVNLAKDLPLLSRGGRVIVIGSRGKIEITPRDVMMREADIRGLSLFNVADDDLRSIHAAIASGLHCGVLKPIIRDELPLSEAARTHTKVLEPGAVGKILLIP